MMRRRRSPLVRLAALVGAAALAVGLTGCGDVNAGTGAVDKLDAVVGGWDELVHVDSSSSNSLPWVGEASATVVVDADTTDDRLEEMTDELGAFLEESEGGTANWMYLELQVGEFRFGIAEDPAGREQRFAAVESLRSDDRVVGGFVWAQSDALVPLDDETEEGPETERVLAGTRYSVRAVVAEGVPLTEAFDIARSAADLVDAIEDKAVVAESADGRSAVSDSEGVGGDTTRATPPDATLALASAIGATAPVADVVATSDSLDIRLTTTADVAPVREAFDEKAQDLGIDLVVNGGVVSDDEGTADPDALAVAQSLDGAAGITAVSVRYSDIIVTLQDASVIPATVDTLLAQPGIGSVSEVSLGTALDQEPGFGVSAPPAGLVRAADLAIAASTQPIVTDLTSSGGTVRFDLTVDPDLEELRSLVSATRPFLDDGTNVQVRAERDGGFTVDVDFVVADELEIEVGRTSGEDAELAALIATAWATAG